MKKLESKNIKLIFALVVLFAIIYYSASLNGGRNEINSIANYPTNLEVPKQSADDIDANGCTKNDPEAILDPSQIKDYSFEYNQKEFQSMEKGALDDGTTFSIRNFGCGYFNLEFTFKLKGREFASKDADFWYEELSRNLLKIEQYATKFKKNIGDISEVLLTYSKNKQSSFNTDVYFECREVCKFEDLGEISHTIIVSHPTTTGNFITGHSTEISITYSIGPL